MSEEKKELTEQLAAEKKTSQAAIKKAGILEAVTKDQAAKISTLAEKNKELEAQLKVIADAKKSDQSKKPTVPDAFEFDGKMYNFTLPAFKFAGNKVLTQEVAKDPTQHQEALKHLIKIGSPILKKVNA